MALDKFSCGADVRLVPEVIGVEWSRVIAKVLRGFVSRVRDVSGIRGDRAKRYAPADEGGGVSDVERLDG